MDIVLLLVGFVLLIKGADFFVDGASSIADHLRIPAIVVGLTIVAFGTSAPEAAVSITAGLSGSNEIALGNVVGSNIFNLLMVIGCASFIKKISVKESMIKKEFPFMIFAGILMTVFCLSDMTISRLEGLILFVLVIFFVAYTVIQSIRGRKDIEVETPKFSVIVSILISLVGLVLIIFGGQWVVNSASNIALALGLSETLVGLTIVSIGTSLPELVTSIVAARKGQSDIAIGNVVGSNIFNILFILGASSLVKPIAVVSSMFTDLSVMLFAFVICFLMAKFKKEYTKKEGFVLIALFVCYMAYIIIRN